MSKKPSKDLQVFDNPHPERNFVITHHVPEFTCLCPLTGQPDFAKIKIEYIADKKCVELKSLKMYMWSFREEGGFHEAMTNRFLDDLVKVMDPRYIRVTGHWFVRGGINTDVMVEHLQTGWEAKPVQQII